MKFRIENDCLHNIGLIIQIQHFIFLTGKSINFSKRENKVIIVTRRRGHIRIADEKFILLEKYKYNGNIYRCVCIDAKGTAGMEPLGTKLKMAVGTKPEEWEIV